MKKLAIVFIGFFLIAFSMNVNAQTEVTSTPAVTTAEIITPIAIVKSGDLSFGNIVANTTAGTVTVATDGTRSATGGVTLPAATPGVISAASFTVTGLDGATYAITLPSAFQVSSGGNVMDVNTFVTDPSGTGTLGTGGTAGQEVINLGATIEVTANQAAGTYTNTTDLTLTVAYN